MPNVDDIISSLQDGSVRPPDGTGKGNGKTGYDRGDGVIYMPSGASRNEEAEVDKLFGDSPGYIKYRNENLTHRLILWMSMNRMKPREIAAALRVSKETVYLVRKQPWFQRAFCLLVAEKAGDEVQEFLQGEVLPTLEKLVELRDNAESEAVQLAAADKLLDRIRGKPTVHVKSEFKGDLNVTSDVTELQKELARNQEILRSRGIGGPGTGTN